MHHYFENIIAVILLVDLDKYDNVVEKYSTVCNQVQDSKELFGTVITSPLFTSSCTMLCLNKKDSLEEKIMQSHSIDYFPKFVSNEQYIGTEK